MDLKKNKCLDENGLCTNFSRMLIRKSITLLFIILFLLPLKTLAVDNNINVETKPTKVIYETDMCADVDDVGGLGILHALANEGKAEILAVCFNEVHPSGAAAIDAINTWYKRGDIPIGVYKGHLDDPDNSAYLDYLENFPHDLESSDAPSALDVYRQVLNAQPDSSVTIISVGFLNNLNDLLSNEPDLIAKKVKKLVIMAGIHNDNFNLSRHNLVNASENVIKNWPTPIIFSQAGGDILTGDNLKNAPPENPVREAYYRYFGGEYNGRPSWDPMTVLYGVTNSSYYFNVESSGTGSLINGYTWQMQEGFRSYLTTRLSNSSYEHIIDNLLDQLPIGAHFVASTQQGWKPLSVDFDASSSIADAGHTIQKYLWYFGDGTIGEGKKITHIFNVAGEFKVKLVIVDDNEDSLQYISSIYVNDPIFSSFDFYGDARNYLPNQEDLWSTKVDSNNLRYYLSNNDRNSEISLPGFCFIKDSTFSEFSLSLNVRTGEILSQNKYANYSIIFGYQNDKNYNYLLMKTTTSQLINVSNGQSTYLAYISQKGIPNVAYHKLQIKFEKSQLTVFLDDSLFVSSNSSRLFSGGKIGFGSDKYAVYFDNINIKHPVTSLENKTFDKVRLNIKLWQNYPNPFNPDTKILFSLPYSGKVILEIFNIQGKKVCTLLSKTINRGSHQVTWKGIYGSGQLAPSGIYFARLTFEKTKKIIKMYLIR